MSSNSEQNGVTGVLIVDKPAGITSFKVVSRLRKILHVKKIGHAGTLDPFATGLLVLCIGRQATKHISHFMEGEKEYLASLRLGVETDTGDPEGTIIAQHPVNMLTEREIVDVLKEFVGVQMQTPPAYSALKHQGKPLYYYARKGIPVVKEPRRIIISILERLAGGDNFPEDANILKLRIVCSKGTYIRTLAADIGRKLGCGAYLEELRRTRSGAFAVSQAMSWELLSGDNAYAACKAQLIPVDEVCKLLQ
jgi:tRNA pseudouridine55 synthase